MASNVVEEKVSLQVVEVEKRGKEGKYKEKAVKYKDKTYTVGKKDKDSVKVGKTYEFTLTKSEYNDKLYYWANLVESEGKKEEGSSSSNMDSKAFFDYWAKLSPENQKKAFKYFFDNNKFLDRD